MIRLQGSEIHTSRMANVKLSLLLSGEERAIFYFNSRFASISSGAVQKIWREIWKSLEISLEVPYPADFSSKRISKANP